MLSALFGIVPEVLFYKITPLVSFVLLPSLLLSISRQKNAPDTASSFKEEYDYVIIGAGSAGSTLAARLSEVQCVSVLLLEAGKAPPIMDDIPVLARNFWDTDIDWQYLTVPQKHTGNGLDERRVKWPAGKALGGSSTLNAMLYVRGNKKNFDDWAAQGATGWSYKEVLPYFLKMEDNTNPDYYGNKYHSKGGPLTVQKSGYDSEIKEAIFKAAKEMDYKIVDVNGENQTGFVDLEVTMRDGQRCSTAKAYLVPAENRLNLDILAESRVRKILIENKRAVGVSFDYGLFTREVRARKEVIVSAGAINSAQILMLSGIGPKDHLEKKKIPVIADLPVGNNLQDHQATQQSYLLPPSIPNLYERILNYTNIKDYIDNRKGPVSSPEMISVIAFLNGLDPHPPVDYPNYQLYFVEADAYLPAYYQLNIKDEVYKQVYYPYEFKPFYWCLSQILNPKSRGTVRLNSDDPYDQPLIDPKYFEDPSDFKDIIQGMKMCQRIGTSKALQELGSKPFDTLYPGCEELADDEDKYFECQAKSVVCTIGHPVGTAKMGSPKDPTTVVDPKLRVKGVKSLRVIDASIMPTITTGNTNTPTIMIAEKAADIIKETIRCD